MKQSWMVTSSEDEDVCFILVGDLQVNLLTFKGPKVNRMYILDPTDSNYPFLFNMLMT